MLVVGSPTTYEPTNIALAINSECNNGQTLAAAYQKVTQYDTRVRISGAGRREIAAIRVELEQLRNSGLDIFAIQRKVDELAGRLVQVLETEVYPIGRPADGGTASTTTTTAGAAASSTTTTTTEAPTTTTTAASSTTTTTAAP